MSTWAGTCALTNISPPRDFREMTFNGSSRPKMGPNNMMSPSHRASSYSTRLSQISLFGFPLTCSPAKRPPIVPVPIRIEKSFILPDLPDCYSFYITRLPTDASFNQHRVARWQLRSWSRYPSHETCPGASPHWFTTRQQRLFERPGIRRIAQAQIIHRQATLRRIRKSAITSL